MFIAVRDWPMLFFILSMLAIVITIESSKISSQTEIGTDLRESIITSGRKTVNDLKKITTAAKPIQIDQIRCMATNIYYEAKNEPYLGQIAVARVVMNRVSHGFANTPCEVIYQSNLVASSQNPTMLQRLCQFSWVCQQKSQPNYASNAYKQAEDIARQVLYENAGTEVIPNNVLYFHNSMIKPGWTHQRLVQIGNHVFYAKRGKKNESES